MKSVGLWIGAAVLAVAIVGVSLGSNRFLDAHGIANEPGLTIEQRKAKAKRNQLEWDERIKNDD